MHVHVSYVYIFRILQYLFGILGINAFCIISDHPLCPVSSFEKYVSKLHPRNKWLWQRIADSFDNNSAWYIHMPLGKNTLAHMLKTICNQEGVTTDYNNHSIRATSITVLDVRKFSNRNIISVSGHKSESSLKSYTSRVSTERKHEMSTTLLDTVVPQQKQNAENHTPSHVRINNVVSEVNCNGIIDMTPEQIDALMIPIETEEQEKENLPIIVNMSSTTCNNIQSNTSAPNCGLEKFGQFTPYITGCVVNVYMK